MQNRNAVLTALAKRPRSERADRRCGTGEITPILRHCFCSLGVVSSVPHLPVPHLPAYFGAGLVVWVIGIVSPYLFGSSEAAHERRLRVAIWGSHRGGWQGRQGHTDAQGHGPRSAVVARRQTNRRRRWRFYGVPRLRRRRQKTQRCSEWRR